MQPFAIGCDVEQAAPHVLRLDGEAASVVEGHRPADVLGLAVLVAHLEGHAVVDAVDEVSALGIEGHHQVVLLLPRQTCLGALIHVARVIVACLLGLAVDGQHTAVEPVPDTEIVGGHLAVVEMPGVIAVVLVFADVEVQHPAGVGAQLIVAAVERVGEGKLPTGEAGGTDDDGLSLDEQSVRREQLDIEQAAHVSGLQVVSTHDVGLVPQRVADKIALVVGVDIDFLLYLLRGRSQQCLTDVVNPVRAGIEQNATQQTNNRCKE